MKSLITFIFIGFSLIGCGGHQEKYTSKQINQPVYKNVFGDEYLAVGSFQSKNKDSIESKQWYFSYLHLPEVLYGNYSDGIPDGKWDFVVNPGRTISSNWNRYYNKSLRCEFSLPFIVTDTLFNPYLFKLTNINDSLGKVSIIVGVTDTVIKDQDLQKYGFDRELGLQEQGYTFTRKLSQIKAGNNTYIFTEFFMKDAAGKNMKLYDLYGYLPSKKHFVQFTMFHDGPKDDWVKIIYTLMAQSLYIDNERFLNPYLMRSN